MIKRLRQRLTTSYITFVIARLAGVGVKPLVLLLAGLFSRDSFAIDYALLVSALAGLFVLAGAQTHIEYYNRRFSGGSIGYYKAYREYLKNTVIQYLLVLPLVAAVALLWTHDIVIIVCLLVLVGVEKFFDEDMRHFLFTRGYYGWSLSFAFRTIIPSFAIMALLPFWGGRLIVVYTLLVLLSMATYAVLRSRHFRFYVLQTKSFASRVKADGPKQLAKFSKRWREDLAFNQMWTFLSVNILLVDRLLVANLYTDRIAQYVFFSNIFNLVNVAHSLFYFTPRRPELIRNLHASAWGEFLRLPNLLPPIIYLTISLIASVIFSIYVPSHANVSYIMFGGLACFYFLQAINQVVIEYVFWRVSRRWLVAIDGFILVTVGLTIYASTPPIQWLPYMTSCALLMRLLAYQWLERFAGKERIAAEAID